MTTSESQPIDAFGLTQIVASPVERVPVRRRESPNTSSAWRLEVTCDQGTGGIVAIEASPDQTYYRGDGLFLGWPQPRLAEVFKSLSAPRDDDPYPSLQQLG
jgi:hypothetical protein